MGRQRGFFDTDERLRWLSEAGDPLDRLAAVVEFELFRPKLEAALNRSDRAEGGRPPCDAVLMSRVLVLQKLHTLSDEQTEYRLRTALLHALRRAVARRSGAGRQDDLAVPRAARPGGRLRPAVERFEAILRERGFLAMGGQIVDGEPRRPPPVRGPRERSSRPAGPA